MRGSCWPRPGESVAARAGGRPPISVCAFRRWRFPFVVRRAWAYSVLPAGLFPVVSMCQTFLACVAKARPMARRALSPVSFFSPALEGHLQSELNQAWIPSALHASEIASVREVAVWLEELRMVESIKQFPTELQFEPLADRRNFQERNLPIVDSRSAANRSRGIPDRSGQHCVFRERARIESQVPWPSRVEFLERRRHVRLSRSLEVEAGLQLDIILLRNSNREARLERRDFRHRPASQRFGLETFVRRDR